MEGVALRVRIYRVRPASHSPSKVFVIVRAPGPEVRVGGAFALIKRAHYPESFPLLTSIAALGTAISRGGFGFSLNEDMKTSASRSQYRVNASRFACKCPNFEPKPFSLGFVLVHDGIPSHASSTSTISPISHAQAGRIDGRERCSAPQARNGFKKTHHLVGAQHDRRRSFRLRPSRRRARPDSLVSSSR